MRDGIMVDKSFFEITEDINGWKFKNWSG
jgi:hypothetical protein